MKSKYPVDLYPDAWSYSTNNRTRKKIDIKLCYIRPYTDKKGYYWHCSIIESILKKHKPKDMMSFQKYVPFRVPYLEKIKSRSKVLKYHLEFLGINTKEV